MNDHPLASVIIPTYNRNALLEKAIASILAQTFNDFEIIVVDDGSIESASAVIDRFMDSRIHYIYQENSGLSASRNAGIKYAGGEYIAFLDDDDLWLPDKLARQLQVFENDPQVGWVTSGYQTIDGEGNLLGEVQPWIWRPELDLQTWLYACPTIPSAVMVRRKWLDLAGAFNQSISKQGLGSEDWELWLRLANLGCKMAWAKEILCAYRVHSTSMAHNAKKQRQGMILTLDHFFSLPDIPPEIETQKNIVYSHAYLRGAAREYAAGLVDDAAADVGRAVQLNPGLLEDGCEVLFASLAGWIGSPLVSDPLGYAQSIFAHLPASVGPFPRQRRQFMNKAAKQACLNSARPGGGRAAQVDWLKIVLCHPALLADRQIQGLIVERFFGKRAKSQIKKLITAIGSW